jgi:hypothetical protein
MQPKSILEHKSNKYHPTIPFPMSMSRQNAQVTWSIEEKLPLVYSYSYRMIMLGFGIGPGAGASWGAAAGAGAGARGNARVAAVAALPPRLLVVPPLTPPPRPPPPRPRPSCETLTMRRSCLSSACCCRALLLRGLRVKLPPREPGPRMGSPVSGEIGIFDAIGT